MFIWLLEELNLYLRVVPIAGVSAFQGPHRFQDRCLSHLSALSHSHEVLPWDSSGSISGSLVAVSPPFCLLLSLLCAVLSVTWQVLTSALSASLVLALPEGEGEWRCSQKSENSWN